MKSNTKGAEGTVARDDDESGDATRAEGTATKDEPNTTTIEGVGNIVQTDFSFEKGCHVSPASDLRAVFSHSSRGVATVLEHLCEPPGESNTGSTNESVSICTMRVQLGWKGKLQNSLTIRTFDKAII